MAPGVQTDIPDHTRNGTTQDNESPSYPKPLQPSGALDRKFKFEETTPIIGREYPDVNIVDDLLNAEDVDALLRDLAITISRRGVVFFRAQTNLTNDLQKTLVHRLGVLTNKPSTSTLHIHPILNNTSEFGVADAQISTISSLARKKIFAHDIAASTTTAPGAVPLRTTPRRYDAAQWHSDIQFEPVPADYTSLRLTTLPSSGGDTLWASGYELYDRFSPAYRSFLETLTATFSGDGFLKAAAADPERVKIYEDERGSPENVGRALQAVHPVVRTNPVTGWKSIFALGPFPRRVNELHADEGEELLGRFLRGVYEGHDLQVRFKWRNEHDFAIWDNRSVFHSATFDYEGLGERFGNRAVGIGEKPYLDPKSKSRTEALAEEANAKVQEEESKGGVSKNETVTA